MKLIANLADIDRQAVAQGIPAETLMENAGSHVARVAQACLNSATVIVCGPGNNGGDGFVCARHLYESGVRGTSIVYTDTGYRNEALANFERLMALPLPVINANSQREHALEAIRQADLIVDGLFGSGLTRDITGLPADLITAIRANETAHVIAIDLPSGIDGATGQVQGVAVTADETVTFAAAKPGLYLQPGKAHAGRVHVADIGIPAALLEADESPCRLITDGPARDWLPEKVPAGHKYDNGHVLVIAGSRDMPGAAAMTAEAAARSGAGMITLAAPESVFTQMPFMPELLRLPLLETADGQLGLAAVDMLLAQLGKGRYDALALGPGLGQANETVQAVWRLLAAQTDARRAVIVDADALNALSRLRDTGFLPNAARPEMPLGAHVILTPHVGEAARLLGADSEALLADLVGAACRLREGFNTQVVLKSASTVIATTDGLIRISPTGNPGMAKGGSGDVLTGIIAGLAAQRAAQGLSLPESAPLGVYVHGLAGDAAASALSEYAMTATDMTRHLPDAFARLIGGTS